MLWSTETNSSLGSSLSLMSTIVSLFSAMAISVKSTSQILSSQQQKQQCQHQFHFYFPSFFTPRTSQIPWFLGNCGTGGRRIRPWGWCSACWSRCGSDCSCPTCSQGLGGGGGVGHGWGVLLADADVAGGPSLLGAIHCPTYKWLSSPGSLHIPHSCHDLHTVIPLCQSPHTPWPGPPPSCCPSSPS